MAVAAGTAAMVAGTTFGVAAFADSAPEATEAVNEVAAEAPAEDTPFIAEDENADKGQEDEARAQAEDAREDAASSSSSEADGEVSPKEEKPEPKPEPKPKAENKSNESSGGGGDSASSESSDNSGNSGGGGGSSVPSGSPREIARAMLSDYGWGDDQWSCLDNLWNKESGWDHTAENPGSGAYGIPQSLPGDKMASAGSDWRTNPATQIEWGLGYIKDRYGSPCSAWSHSQSVNWY